jgi:hypothetical protein
MSPSPHPSRYVAIARRRDALKLSSEMVDLIQRRTFPFLDSNGMGKSIEHLMAEAYLQGISDTVECYEIRGMREAAK